MKLIDKSALVAEIEKRRNKHFNSGGSPSSEYCHEDDEILGIIATLEVKEVDLEAEYDKYIDKHTGEWLRDEYMDLAKHFFTLGMQVSNKVKKRE